MTLDEALELAEAGNVTAMVAVAKYYTQEAMENNAYQLADEKALPWYEKAASLGDAFSKKMAGHLHFMNAHATWKAFGVSYAQNDYEQEIGQALEFVLSMETPDSDLLQSIREDQAMFYLELAFTEDGDMPNRAYLEKTIEYMLPYATSYHYKEALQSLVIALSILGQELPQMGAVDTFVQAVMECESDYSENELYKISYALIWFTVGNIYLHGLGSYQANDDSAYHCFEKSCTYEDTFASMLKKFRKKLFGGYVYRP